MSAEERSPKPGITIAVYRIAKNGDRTEVTPTRSIPGGHPLAPGGVYPPCECPLHRRP